MKLKIKVTKEILHRSAMCGKTPESNHNSKNWIKGCYTSNCAVALAAQQFLPDARVSNKYLFGNGYNILLPESAQKFIALFDMLCQNPPESRANMQEIEFEIEVPQEVINQIGITELKTLLENVPDNITEQQ